MNSLAIKKDFETWKKNSLDSAVNIGDEFLGMSTHIIVSYNKKDNLYNAHSLEFDIVVEGKTEDKVLKGVLESIFSHIEFCIVKNKDKKITFPAPNEYWKEFYEGIKSGSVIDKPKIPKLKSVSQLPYTTNRINQLCVMGV